MTELMILYFGAIPNLDKTLHQKCWRPLGAVLHQVECISYVMFPRAIHRHNFISSSYSEEITWERQTDSTKILKGTLLVCCGELLLKPNIFFFFFWTLICKHILKSIWKRIINQQIWSQSSGFMWGKKQFAREKL